MTDDYPFDPFGLHDTPTAQVLILNEHHDFPGDPFYADKVALRARSVAAEQIRDGKR